jgi:hypothetical protein
MFIERLSFQVIPPDRMEDFIAADEKIWDPWLRQQKGYLRKTVQRYPGGRVDLRIFWANLKDMEKAARDPQIPAIEVKLQSSFLGVYQRLS